MSGARPFSVCYVVPGHNLLPSAGPTRNVLSLARALAALEEVSSVTVAFRRVLQAPADEGYTAEAIEPGGEPEEGAIDDAAVRGVGYRDFAAYVRRIRSFARERLPAFDVVLEKSWLLSGYVSALCGRRGIPSVPVENLVPVAVEGWRDPLKAVRNRVARTLAGRYLRRAPLLVAETGELKAAMVRCWRVPPQRIEVVPLGVDRQLFRPLDRGTSRRALGIDGQRTVLLYVGVLDRAHDLAPVIRAVVTDSGKTELHVVGDGSMRREYETLAAPAPERVRFHGRVPHTRVPLYIGAADLCLAPYDPAAFPNGQVGYATLKVREYLSAGRPVATVRSGGLPDLVRDGESGFLVEPEATGWGALLENLPSPERLTAMGEAAAATELGGWEGTARAYAHVCRRAMAMTAEEGTGTAMARSGQTEGIR